MTIHPGDTAPNLEIATTGGEALRLPGALLADRLTMLVVYRGLHCGICKQYLAELAMQAQALRKLGVEVIAASSDPLQKARVAQTDWTGNRLRFGYGLTEEHGRLLRLFLTAKRKDGEPDRFFEPGMYLFDAAGKVLFVAVGNMPFGRPPIAEMVSRIEWMLANGVPPRGTLRY